MSDDSFRARWSSIGSRWRPEGTDLDVHAGRTTYTGDDDLAIGLRRKDPDAVEVLYERLGRQAFGLAYRILGDGPAAEDVVQEAFLTVWRQADRVDPARGKLSSFVMTVVHHKAIDNLRVRRGITARQVSLDPGILEKQGPDVSERVLQTMDRDAVRAAILGLPDDQRTAVQMAYFEGLTHVDISEKTGIPLGTVKSRLRLALVKMRATLRGENAG